jgi:hypothetical protein
VDVSAPVVPVIEPESNLMPVTVSVRVFALNIPPFTKMLEVLANTLLAPMVSVPALTVVVPVYVFAPESVTVPAVILFSPTAPPSILLTVPERKS